MRRKGAGDSLSEIDVGASGPFKQVTSLLANPRRSGLGMTFFVGGVLFLSLFFVAVVFLPLVGCPICEGQGTIAERQGVVGDSFLAVCHACKGTKG